MKTNGYTDLGIVSAKIPVNTHLWIEINSNGGFYFVATGDLTHLWYSADKMDTEAKIDVDPGDAWGGDDDHRPLNILSAFHDRANKIIYFIDNSGGNTIYAWKLDYSGSESTPSITELSSIEGLNGVTGADIFLSTNLTIVYTDGDEIGSNWWVDPNWISKSILGPLLVTVEVSYAVVPSTGLLDYILMDETSEDQVDFLSITKATGDLDNIESEPGVSFPPANQRGVAYNGSEFATFILTLDADGKEYLYSYSTTDTPADFTKGGEYNVALMMDRNTAFGVKEKAFHITNDNIYQLHSIIGYQLHLIALPPTDAVWVAITDNFIINDDGDVWEYEDITKYVMDATINMKKMGAWSASMAILDKIPIEKDMFITITDRFTSANNSPFLYKGTYNFKDELGEEGTDIGFIDSMALHDGEVIIIDEWLGHKNILRLQDDATPGEDPVVRHFITQATSGTHEFWVGSNDVSELWELHFFEAGNDYIIRFRIEGGNLKYRARDDTFPTIIAVVNNILYHIKVVWRADDTFDVFVNGTKEVDNQQTNNVQVSGPTLFRMQGFGDSEDYLYIDAYGETEDPSYTVGDNNYIAEGKADQIIFEGYVGPFTKRKVQEVSLISPAQRDLDEEFPEGDYAGRTDEIIVLLLAAYSDYITAGTLSEGMAMGTITFEGDKSLREILDEFALQDNFIWYLTPTGVLYYNDGTVDSLVLLTSSSPISNVDKTFGVRATNYVDVKGALVNGIQITGTPAENVPDQQTNGRFPFEQTFSHLDLAAQCTTTNTNILTRLGTQPMIVPFTHRNSLFGPIQPGEVITFEYDLTVPNISKDLFLILDCIYDALRGRAMYRISDHVI